MESDRGSGHLQNDVAVARRMPTAGRWWAARTLRPFGAIRVLFYAAPEARHDGRLTSAVC